MSDGFSRPAVAAFELFFRPWMRKRIHAVHLAGLPARIPLTRPILLAANHVSWWDAFLLRELQRMLRPRAPLHVVMAREGLARFPYFRRMGVVGVDRSPRAIARTLRTLGDRTRARPDSVIAYFPQGRIWPSHRRPLGFERGLELFTRRLSPVVLPVAIHLEPLNHASPTAFVSCGEPTENSDAREIESAVEAELDVILGHLSRRGEDAPRAWAAPFERLPRPGG